MPRHDGKRLLILGGLSGMDELAARAKELGATVLVTDYYEDSPAKRVADECYLTSATDVEAVVSLCKSVGVDGVCIGYTELLFPYYVAVCEALGLPCYGTSEVFSVMSDKAKFKETCREYGVPTIEELGLDGARATVGCDRPLLVKPVDSGGSRGISICRSAAQLDEAIDKALSYSRSGRYLLERYMTGDEVVLYYYFQDGEAVFAGMCDRYVNKQQEGVAQLPTAYVFPSRHTKEHLAKTDALMKNMFRGVGVTNGPLFLQAFIDGGAPCVYEPGFRLNGAREHYIFSHTGGVSALDMIIDFALTGSMCDGELAATFDPFMGGMVACKLSPLIGRGEVSKIVGMEEAASVKSVVKIVKNNDVGSVIGDAEVGQLRQVAYRAFLVADDFETLARDIAYVEGKVDYLDASGKSMLLEQFDPAVLMELYK